ncbi:FAD-dependent monooxygenase [Salinispora pacifica]|uniref:FAD-dependent monooxygenase n=1 Tax=Salinispora pacifica TaxID=351187 RepID=UPI0004814FAB|nr:FAD-dependent monooxygenase [Salinispora pacifica]
MDTDVIVVGAGPVGLMLAVELHLGGARVRVYDRLAAATGESRALGFNRRAAESLDQRGLLARLAGIRWGPMGHFGGVRIDLSRLDDDHSGILGLPQARTEQMLTDWLAAQGVPVIRRHELTGVREAGNGVVAAFAEPGGGTEVRAHYLVGCDGARSTVRALAGIKASGPAATRGMYTAEITGVELRPRPIGERRPGGSMVVCTPVGDGRYRIVLHDRGLPSNPDPDALTFAEVADAWQRLTGESLHHGSAQWLWACGNAAAVAEQYRRGRIFLAGDAAHEMPPLAAWGLSAGLQDAVNLGWKLAAAVHGWAPPDLLDTYHTERHPIGRQLIADAQAASSLYLGDEAMEPIRSVLAELVTHTDAAEHLAGRGSGLGIRYDLGPGEHPLLGRRMPPHHQLTLPNGDTPRITDLLHPARPLLITTTTAHPTAHPWTDRIDIITGTWTHQPHPTLHTALIRPDGYLAWTAPGSTNDLTHALTRWFGAPQNGTGPSGPAPAAGPPRLDYG